MRGPRLALVALLATGALAGCGDDDDDGGDGASAADLKKQLLPESDVPGYKVQRTFAWDNATDAVVQGLFLPEETPPSRGVEVYEDAGFEAGAGEQLVKGNPFEGPHAAVVVIEFGSEDGARDALDFVHGEDLKQPCFAVCSVNPREMAVDGIPGAKGAQLLPLRNPPDNAPPPFEAYAVEFTVGARLFVVGGSGGPEQVDKTFVLDAAKRYYARNKAGS
jgi:hypothetical protein